MAVVAGPTTFSHVRNCVPRDEDQRSLIDQVGKMLRPGGVLFLADFLLASDTRNRERYAASEAEHGTYGIFSTADGAVHRHHDPRWMEELLNGFDRVAGHEFTATTRRGNSARGFQFVGRSRRTSDSR